MALLSPILLSLLLFFCLDSIFRGLNWGLVKLDDVRQDSFAFQVRMRRWIAGVADPVGTGGKCLRVSGGWRKWRSLRTQNFTTVMLKSSLFISG